MFADDCNHDIDGLFAKSFEAQMAAIFGKTNTPLFAGDFQTYNEAYGTTFEPIVFIYNKSDLSEQDVPQTHADVAQFLIKQKNARSGVAPCTGSGREIHCRQGP